MKMPRPAAGFGVLRRRGVSQNRIVNFRDRAAGKLVARPSPQARASVARASHPSVPNAAVEEGEPRHSHQSRPDICNKIGIKRMRKLMRVKHALRVRLTAAAE